MKHLKKILKEIDFQWWLFKLNFREFLLKIRGFDRDFDCQSNYEMRGKCKNQCEHCKCYYQNKDKY